GQLAPKLSLRRTAGLLCGSSRRDGFRTSSDSDGSLFVVREQQLGKLFEAGLAGKPPLHVEALIRRHCGYRSERGQEPAEFRYAAVLPADQDNVVARRFYPFRVVRLFLRIFGDRLKLEHFADRMDGLVG